MCSWIGCTSASLRSSSSDTSALAHQAAIRGGCFRRGAPSLVEGGARRRYAIDWRSCGARSRRARGARTHARPGLRDRHAGTDRWRTVLGKGARPYISTDRSMRRRRRRAAARAATGATPGAAPGARTSSVPAGLPAPRRAPLASALRAARALGCVAYRPARIPSAQSY